ncbi:MAG: AAA family ATPase [Zestosphaera sp.]
MIFYLRSIIDEELESGYFLNPPPLEDINYVINFMIGKLKNHNIAVVQGPPGTRKTLSMFSSVERVLDNLDQNELIIYVAPTNALIAQGLRYAVRVLFRKGYTQKEILEFMRVYGSQFRYEGDCRKLRDKVSSETKIILTTPYQTPSIKDRGVFHIMIDEASRMKFHEAFMEVRKEIIDKVSKDESLEGSMIVVGDPMQAIVLPEDYREFTRLRNERLILESFVAGLLERSGIDTKNLESTELMRAAREHLRGEWYELIDTTYRLPGPTEEPISTGYYAGELRAKFSFNEKIKQLGIDIGNSPKLFEHEVLNKLSEAVFECLSTGRPMLIVEPTQEEWLDENYGILTEPYRTYIAGALGIVLSSYGFKTTVVTAYRDQAFYAKMLINEKYGIYFKRENLVRPDYINVHRLLGGENEAIVAVMGKEYKTSRTEMQTVYFQEPELLNVQLSRHSAFLAVVGNPRLLVRSARELSQRERTTRYKPIIETTKELVRLVGVEEREVDRATRGRIKYEGNAGIYIRWEI